MEMIAYNAAAGRIGHKRKEGKAFVTVTGHIGNVGHDQLSGFNWSDLRYGIDQVRVALEVVPRVSGSGTEASFAPHQVMPMHQLAKAISSEGEGVSKLLFAACKELAPTSLRKMFRMA